ncbi:MAG TPA: bifunctional diaminohydroxyphosphoribosylaminopyrimidine deaminase/5-amino-6-(5-phosphoribosylamino)uracil reductase RibD, partial [Saprospiraceae bacterium]|nr:bifunctional diaminohydroxyphosphoribosylaminopyrimidine deaminase/5-amino-6-(5-phosphoribosylamino)uracil reductase RibD [Saprospiraceae bacterium]
VSPNPPVGALLVYRDKILAEGYHHAFGAPHAEVEAVQHVPPSDRHLIRESTLYVTLEPCCTYGKTPPCTDLILKEGIKEVRISVVDPNPSVSGRSLALLEANGVRVISGILEAEGRQLISAFTTNVLYHRPHVVLKWAQSKYGISGVPGQQVWFSQKESQVFTHQLRAAHDAILVGARTVETDDPALTTRHFPGRSPARVIYDPSGRLNSDYKAFQEDGIRIFYFSSLPVEEIANSIKEHPFVTFGHLTGDNSHASQILKNLFSQNIGSLLVEGGAHTHRLFVAENLWDEAWVIQTQNDMATGLTAPSLIGKLISKENLSPDVIIGMANEHPAKQLY